jgi:hypothetical protein
MEAEPETCVANNNPPPPALPLPGLTCYRLFKGDLENSTLAPLLVDTVAATETGSFGAGSSTFGDVFVEITEKGPTGRPVAGSDIGGTGTSLKFAKVTLTTTGQTRPWVAGDNNTCDDGVAAVASKKVLRARVVVGPI